jgi:flagellar assembly protein FliH
MKWPKTISFTQVPRDIRLSWSGREVERPPGEELAQAREQATYERGLADGEKRLSEQLLRQRAEVLELQNGVLASLRGAVPQVIRQTEAALIELALEIAQKLVDDLPISAAMVEAAVRSALAQAEECAEILVQLHADDLALLQQANSPVLLPGPGREPIRFQVSSEVSRGGCLVQTRFGVIDSQRETKLDLIRQSLRP